MNTRGQTTNTDALEREVFRYTMQAITEELEINIVRTAYSPLIQEAQDYCIALITADFRTFAQSERGIPIFCSNMGDAVRDAVSIIGTDRLEPGDVFANNYASGQHVNNTVVATPLFDGDAIIAYLAMRTHWADTGGLIPGAQSMSSRSIFHEGARYRGLRLMRRGEVVPEVMETIRINTYQPTALIGDIMAQLAGCQLGARRWRERVMTRWSAEQITALIEEQFRTSAAAVRRAIAAIPDGKYSAEHPWLLRQGGVDLDMTLKLAMIVDGERLVVDLSGMPPQTELPINAGREGGGSAAVRLALRLLVDADVPTDHGSSSRWKSCYPRGPSSALPVTPRWASGTPQCPSSSTCSSGPSAKSIRSWCPPRTSPPSAGCSSMAPAPTVHGGATRRPPPAGWAPPRSPTAAARSIASCSATTRACQSR